MMQNIEVAIAQVPCSYLLALDRILGLDTWLGSQDWISGLDPWLGSLAWIPGLDPWLGSLAWIPCFDPWLIFLVFIPGLDLSQNQQQGIQASDNSKGYELLQLLWFQGGFHLHLFNFNSRKVALVCSSFANDKFRWISTSFQHHFKNC